LARRCRPFLLQGHRETDGAGNGGHFGFSLVNHVMTSSLINRQEKTKRAPRVLKTPIPSNKKILKKATNNDKKKNKIKRIR
jgi:hypothetical protein